MMGTKAGGLRQHFQGLAPAWLRYAGSGEPCGALPDVAIQITESNPTAAPPGRADLCHRARGDRAGLTSPGAPAAGGPSCRPALSRLYAPSLPAGRNRRALPVRVAAHESRYPSRLSRDHRHHDRRDRIQDAVLHGQGRRYAAPRYRPEIPPGMDRPAARDRHRGQSPSSTRNTPGSACARRVNPLPPHRRAGAAMAPPLPFGSVGRSESHRQWWLTARAYSALERRAPHSMRLALRAQGKRTAGGLSASRSRPDAGIGPRGSRCCRRDRIIPAHRIIQCGGDLAEGGERSPIARPEPAPFTLPRVAVSSPLFERPSSPGQRIPPDRDPPPPPGHAAWHARARPSAADRKCRWREDRQGLHGLAGPGSPAGPPSPFPRTGPQAGRKMIGFAPSHSTERPTTASRSIPSRMVSTWLPASCPALEAKQVGP